MAELTSEKKQTIEAVRKSFKEVAKARHQLTVLKGELQRNGFTADQLKPLNRASVTLIRASNMLYKLEDILDRIGSYAAWEGSAFTLKRIASALSLASRYVLEFQREHSIPEIRKAHSAIIWARGNVYRAQSYARKVDPLRFDPSAVGHGFDSIARLGKQAMKLVQQAGADIIKNRDSFGDDWTDVGKIIPHLRQAAEEFNRLKFVAGETPTSESDAQHLLRKSLAHLIQAKDDLRRAEPKARNHQLTHTTQVIDRVYSIADSALRIAKVLNRSIG